MGKMWIALVLFRVLRYNFVYRVDFLWDNPINDSPPITNYQ